MRFHYGKVIRYRGQMGRQVCVSDGEYVAPIDEWVQTPVKI